MSTGILSNGSAAGVSTQAGRPIIISTPLGKDKLLAVGLSATEGFNQLYRFTVDVKAALATKVDWNTLLGGPVGLALTLPGRAQAYRYFHGVCVRLRQGGTDDNFTDYQLDVVPYMWHLTKKADSRIWQQMTVPAILKEVFKGLEYDPKFTKTYKPRDFCVQYRETDFNFATRLMEEEGLYYYFVHYAAGTDIKSKLIVSDDKSGYAAGPGAATVEYHANPKETVHEQDYIHDLAKTQEQITGKFLLWDHSFEILPPDNTNASPKAVPQKVKVGNVDHVLTVGDAANFEVYDWPGEFTQRFDGIPRSGVGEPPATQPTPVKDAAPEGKRTVELRAEAEAAMAVSVSGSGTCRNLIPGHTVTIATQPGDKYSTVIKAEGKYVLTAVTHHARLPANYRSGGGEGFRYSNTFTAIPADVTYRPARTSPKPVVPGTQTAIVVGPPGEEIHTDKYGRIKVQFHWDRSRKKNADSSCWIRVGQFSAGRHWGQFALPRIGQEVIVDFLEGDPDQPICVGCVFNPDQMPQYTLPDNKTRSYIRTNSTPGGEGYHEIRFEDKKDAEQIYIHSQRNMDERVRNDSMERIGNDRHLRVGFYLPNDHKGDVSGEQKKGSQYEEVAVDQHLKVHRHLDQHIGGDMKLLVGGVDGKGNQDVHIKATKHETIDGDAHLHVGGEVRQKFEKTQDLHVVGDVRYAYDGKFDHAIKSNSITSVGGNCELDVKASMATKVGNIVRLEVGVNHDLKVGTNHTVGAGSAISMKAGTSIVLEATAISLKCGGNFITIDSTGVAISGSMVLINSGGAALSGEAVQTASPRTPEVVKPAGDAKAAKPIKPKDADYTTTGQKSN